MKTTVLGYSDKMTYEKWLALRRQGLCGSDAAAVAGESKRRSRMTVYLDKIGDLPPQEEGERLEELFYWGHQMEPVIRKEFTRRSGMKARRCSAVLQHPEHRWLLANIDGLVNDPEVGEAGLECKNVSSFMSSKWEDDMIPEEYQFQVYHYMLTTGIRRWWVAALVGGNKFVWKKIDWDQDVIDALFAVERDFWGLIENRTPPALDGSDACGDLLQRIYKDSYPAELHLDPATEPLCHDYVKARENLKAAEEAKNLAQYRLQEKLGHYEKAKCGEFSLSWKPVSRTGIDTDRLKTERPDIYQEFSKVSTSRRFSLK